MLKLSGERRRNNGGQAARRQRAHCLACKLQCQQQDSSSTRARLAGTCDAPTSLLHVAWLTLVPTVMTTLEPAPAGHTERPAHTSDGVTHSSCGRRV